MPRVPLRELCGVRSGDKGDRSDLSLFADDADAYSVICSEVTADRVRDHFGTFVAGPVERFEVPRLWALKFVVHGALGGGGPRSLRSDNLGKTLGGALLRLQIEVPDAILTASARRGRRAPTGRPSSAGSSSAGSSSAGSSSSSSSS